MKCRPDFRFLPIVWLACQLLIAGKTAAAQERHPSVILISVDTLRADHLSSYGYKALQTPTIDSLAQGGTLFLQISSQVPLTFPSHVSLLTSKYPFSSGVVDNSQILPPHATTLATVLKSHGYRTGAFVGSFVLDRRFGLGEGFDVYDSPFQVNSAAPVELENLKRPAEQVISSAEAWLNQGSGKPFFLFLHLFDLHTPYQIPPGKSERFKVSYDSELSYVDEQLHKFLSFLNAKQIFDNTLVVFLADHGESLGEHGETTHGYFIYQSTLHVPLIFHCPARKAHQTRLVHSSAGLIDVAPTILDALNLPVPDTFEGRSLMNEVQGEFKSDREVYSESLYPALHYQCSALQSMRIGQYQYIQAPRPELYDLEDDPLERVNLYAKKPALAATLREKLRNIQARFSAAGAAAQPAMDPKVAEELRSLGYLPSASTVVNDFTSKIDPKDRLVQYSDVHSAITMAYGGDLKNAILVLEKVVNQVPELNDVRNLLAIFQQKSGQDKDALANLTEVLKADPLNTLAHFNAGSSAMKLNELDRAANEFQAAIAAASASHSGGATIILPARDMLGTVWMQQHRYDIASKQFETVLQTDPRDYIANYSLGWLARSKGNLEEARRRLEIAVGTQAGNPIAHDELGTIYLQEEKFADAEKQFREATALSPESVWPNYNLGLALMKEQRKAEAVSAFRKALAINPKFQPALKGLDQLQRQQ